MISSHLGRNARHSIEPVQVLTQFLHSCQSGSIDVTEVKEILEKTHIFDSVEFPDAYKISYLANAIIIPTYEDVAKELGLLRTEYHLLMCLAHYPALAAKDVAKLTRMPRNSISRAVKRMEEMGYISRATNPDDRRQSALQVTETGRAIHANIAAKFVKREAEILSILPHDELQTFQRLLNKLSVNATNLER